MKINKTYCIDLKLVQRMADEKLNASGLINQLLTNHFEAQDPVSFTNKKQKEQAILKEVEEKMKEAPKKALKEERKKKIKALMEKWRKGEITEKEYWKRVDKLSPKEDKV